MLNTFLATLAYSDVARKNRYRVEITDSPIDMDVPLYERMTLMCEAIEFPGRNFMSQPDLLRYGPPREMATGVTYAPINATFICSPNMIEKRFFEAWQEVAIDMDSWEPRFYKDYTGGLKIWQLDRHDKPTYKIELFEVYPKTITAQDLGYGTNGAYHTVVVELIYHHWDTTDTLAQHRRGTMDIDTANIGTQ